MARVDLGHAVELPVVGQPLDVGVDLPGVLDGAVDQLLGEGVVVARLLQVPEEKLQVVGHVGRLVHAPGVKVLKGRRPAFPALGELTAHDFPPRRRFKAAISSAARANSAPRSIRPGAARPRLRQRVGHDHAVDHGCATVDGNALQGVRHALADHLVVIGGRRRSARPRRPRNRGAAPPGARRPTALHASPGRAARRLRPAFTPPTAGRPPGARGARPPAPR